MNCRPSLSPYLNELHCAHGAHSINGCQALYFLLLTVMKQKIWPYFHNITLAAITEAALLIAHSVSVEHIQAAFAPGACGHESSSVCLPYRNTHEQIALKLFMMQWIWSLCKFPLQGYVLLEAKETLIDWLITVLGWAEKTSFIRQAVHNLPVIYFLLFFSCWCWPIFKTVGAYWVIARLIQCTNIKHNIKEIFCSLVATSSCFHYWTACHLSFVFPINRLAYKMPVNIKTWPIKHRS